MIAARKLAGITNMSNYVNKTCKKTLYVNEVTGSNHKLLVAVGDEASNYAGETGYTKIFKGHHFSYFLSNDAETTWTSMPSGTYEEGFKTTLTAVSQTEGAKLVYTLDGSNPTVKSTTVESGKQITINGSCTLKVGLLINGEVRNIATHQYKIEKFKAYTFMVYVNTDAVNGVHYTAIHGRKKHLLNGLVKDDRNKDHRWKDLVLQGIQYRQSI